MKLDVWFIPIDFSLYGVIKDIPNVRGYGIDPGFDIIPLQTIKKERDWVSICEKESNYKEYTAEHSTLLVTRRLRLPARAILHTFYQTKHKFYVLFQVQNNFFDFVQKQKVNCWTATLQRAIAFLINRSWSKVHWNKRGVRSSMIKTSRTSERFHWVLESEWTLKGSECSSRRLHTMRYNCNEVKKKTAFHLVGALEWSNGTYEYCSRMTSQSYLEISPSSPCNFAHTAHRMERIM